MINASAKGSVDLDAILFHFIFSLVYTADMKTLKQPERGLESIPGVGKSIAQDLRDLGIDRPSCLKGKNPERLYEKLCQLRGEHIDRCMLYVFRCAVYYASTKRPDPKKLQWWAWKDEK